MSKASATVPLLAVTTTDTVEVWSLGTPSSTNSATPLAADTIRRVSHWKPFSQLPTSLANIKWTPRPVELKCLAWGHDGQLLAVGGDAPWIEIYRWTGDFVEAFPVFKPTEHTESQSVHAMEFASDSRTVVFGGSSRQVRRWDRQAQCIAQSFQTHKTTVTAVALSVDKGFIASGSTRGEVLLFNRKTGTKAELKFGTKQAISAMCFSAKRKHTLAAISQDGTVAVWDTHRSATPVRLFSRAHSAPSRGLAFHPQSAYTLYSAGLDQKIVTFDLLKRTVANSTSTTHPLNAMAVHRDGHHVFVGTVTGQVLLLDTQLPAKPLWITSVGARPKAVVSVNVFHEAHVPLDVLRMRWKESEPVVKADPVKPRSSIFDLVPPKRDTSSTRPLTLPRNGLASNKENIGPCPSTTTPSSSTLSAFPDASTVPPLPTTSDKRFDGIGDENTSHTLSRMGTKPAAQKTSESEVANRFTSEPLVPPEKLPVEAPTALADTSMVAKDRSYMDLFSPVGKPASKERRDPLSPPPRVLPGKTSSSHRDLLPSPDRTDDSSQEQIPASEYVSSKPVTDKFPPTSYLASRHNERPIAKADPVELAVATEPKEKPASSATNVEPSTPVRKPSEPARTVKFQESQQPMATTAEPDPIAYKEGDSILNIFSPVAAQKQPVSSFTDPVLGIMEAPKNPPAQLTDLDQGANITVNPKDATNVNSSNQMTLKTTTPQSIRKSALKNRLKQYQHSESGKSPSKGYGLPSVSPTSRVKRKVLFAQDVHLEPPSLEFLSLGGRKTTTPKRTHDSSTPKEVTRYSAVPKPKIGDDNPVSSEPSPQSNNSSVSYDCIRNAARDGLQETQEVLQSDIRNLHIEMHRLFYKHEIMLQELSGVNHERDTLRGELVQLRAENQLLRQKLGYE
ncbi:hypothetical protein IWQ62_005402 [Dispira parvispora]|uniref:WD40 repeat-like protein n=1 Tax=Dispira parvispora TaxID=1520584 RepID=A0A9W8AR28_9FUNG|nr:hypothetical protein IWQ62_005402 [Dispira parvispora]